MTLTNDTNPPATTAEKTRRPGRWRRVTLRSVAVLALVVGLTIIVLNRTNALGRFVLPQISRMFNCDATAGRVSLSLGGRIVVRDLRLRVPGLDGPAGLFLSSPSIELSPRWMTFLRGSPSVRRLALHSPRIRLSQDRELKLNVADLQTGSAGMANLIPTIDLFNGAIEFGEHDGTIYRKLTELRVEGNLEPDSDSIAGYEFKLSEIEGTPGVGAEFERIVVTGTLDLRALAGAATLGNLDLRRLSRTKVPTRLQELWSRMSMDGAVRETIFSYTPESGMEATFRLRDVDLNIPLPADANSIDPLTIASDAEAHDSEWVAMRGVSGEIIFGERGLRAQLTGSIEDLPCRVNLRTDGLELNSGLRCEIEAKEFVVSEQPDLLPFAPSFVSRNFERFSGPTAIVDGNVVLERDAADEDGIAAPLRVRGELSFKLGSAEFETFKYAFTDMSGRITFDDDAVYIDQITGTGPSGAHLLATGKIAPPTPGAGVDLTISVVNVPFDEHMLQALPPARRALANAVFNDEAYANLKQAGLIESRSDRRSRQRTIRELNLDLLHLRAGDRDARRMAELQEDLARLRALDERNRTFDLGGLINDIEIRVRREVGAEAEYFTEINVSIPRAGLLAGVFPYPAIAHDLTLSIHDDEVIIDAPTIEGLSGATGSIKARIAVDPKDPSGPAQYELDLLANGISADAFLLEALPSSGRDSAFEPREVLESLALDGHASCRAQLRSRDDGDLGYEVEVSFEDLAAHPMGRDLRLEHLSGAIVVSESQASIRNLTGSIGQGTFEANVTANIEELVSGQTPQHVQGTVRARDFDLSRPLEDLVQTIAPKLAGTMAGLRRQHDPQGLIDAICTVSTDETTPFTYNVRVTSPRALSARVLGGRIEFDQCAGALEVSPSRISWQRFSAAVEFDDDHAGRLMLDGSWPLGPARDTEGGNLEIDLEDARFESPVLRKLLAMIDESAARTLDRARVRGVFWAHATAVLEPGGAPVLTGELSPRSLTLRRGDQDIRFDRMDGRITLDGDHGRLDQLVAIAPAWTLQASGDWRMDRSFVLDASFSLFASSLSPDLKALLPRAGRNALDSVELAIDGPLSIRDGTILYELDLEGNVRRLDVMSRAEFGTTRLQAIVPIELSDGTASIDAGYDATTDSARLDTRIETGRFKAAGIPLDDGEMRIMMGDGPGVFTVPLFTARTHAGEVVAKAIIRPSQIASLDGTGQEASSYELDLRASGLDFATFLESLRGVNDDESNPDDDAHDPEQFGSRGELDAIFQLAGDTAATELRRGRGLIRIQNGEVLELPGVMGLLRLSNLQPPIGEKLQWASADFFLRGNEMTFERLEASSESVVIVGYGTMLWPSMAIDLQFNTRGNRGVPIISELLRGVRDELLTARVTGTLQAPEYRLEQLPATRRMLSTIFRGRPTSPPRAVPEPTQTAPENEGP